MIELTQDQWHELELRLREEYVAEPSVMLLRSKMRSVLGFVPRQHTSWIVKGHGADGRAFGHYQHRVMLDFYDDAKETFFRLKYL